LYTRERERERERERGGDREIDMDGNGMMGYRELDIYAGNDER